MKKLFFKSLTILILSQAFNQANCSPECLYKCKNLYPEICGCVPGTLYEIDCPCPCERYEQLDDGRCPVCGHYRMPTPIRLVYKNKFKRYSEEE